MSVARSSRSSTVKQRGAAMSSKQMAPKVGADRKSTRLNSSHGYISYAVFCLKKKKTYNTNKERHQQPTVRKQPTSTAVRTDMAQLDIETIHNPRNSRQTQQTRSRTA